MHTSLTHRLTLLLGLLIATVASSHLRADDFQPLRSFMEQSVANEVVVGCAAQITQGGKTIFLEAFGDLDPEASRELRTDDVVCIYSMSKAITSTAAMMLMEEGRLGLDDPVSKYIPEFAEARVASWPEGVERTADTMELIEPDRPIIVRDLLLHTSGLGYSFTVEPALQPFYRGHWQDQDSLESAIAEVARMPLAGHPGTAFIYGLNSDVLGRVVEVASGQPFEVFLEERLFSPLGMVDTRFTPGPPERSMPEAVKRVEDGVLVRGSAGLEGNENPEHPPLPLGGQGLFSTLADYTRFCRMILGKGRLDGTRYLTARTVDFMTRNHLGPNVRAGRMRFGLGFGIEAPIATSRGLRGDGRLAWSGAACTFFFIDPKQDLTAVYVTQLMPWNGLIGMQFQAAVLESMAQREPAPATDP